ncbi:unnamed protein product, partial [marine sediment metagenome]
LKGKNRMGIGVLLDVFDQQLSRRFLFLMMLEI